MIDTINEPFFKQKLWFRVSRWTWVRLAFVLMMLTSVFSNYSVKQNGDADTARTRQIALEQCESGNGIRQVIRDLVVVSYSQGGSIDLTKLDHYAGLDSETKGWVDDLNKILSSSSTPEARQKKVDDALAAVPIRNCVEVINQ